MAWNGGNGERLAVGAWRVPTAGGGLPTEKALSGVHIRTGENQGGGTAVVPLASTQPAVMVGEVRVPFVSASHLLSGRQRRVPGMKRGAARLAAGRSPWIGGAGAGKKSVLGARTDLGAKTGVWAILRGAPAAPANTAGGARAAASHKAQGERRGAGRGRGCRHGRCGGRAPRLGPPGAPAWRAGPPLPPVRLPLLQAQPPPRGPHGPSPRVRPGPRPRHGPWPKTRPAPSPKPGPSRGPGPRPGHGK